MRATGYRTLCLLLTILSATTVRAQDFTFRLRGSSPLGPVIIGNYGILDIVIWLGIALVIYAAVFASLKKTAVFQKEEKAAKLIALGISVSTVTFFMSTEYAFGSTIQQTIGRGMPTWITTPAILLIGLFIGYKLYNWVNS